jgi:outer membrane lipoprotein SlyB
MDTTPTTPHKPGHHPLVILAAIAVVLFCLAGTAAIMGWLPSSIGGNAANRPLSEADRMTLAAGMPQDAAPVAPPVAQAPYPAQPYAAAPAALAPQPVPPSVYEPEPAPRARVHTEHQLAAAEPAREHWCANCGNVESVRTITTRAQGSGMGAGVGAVLGGLLGNQVGSGNGRTLATAAGAVGGAVVGNQVEGNMKANTSYEIRVRLDDGHVRTFHQHSAPQWQRGDRVRIVKGSLRSA